MLDGMRINDFIVPRSAEGTPKRGGMGPTIRRRGGGGAPPSLPPRHPARPDLGLMACTAGDRIAASREPTGAWRATAIRRRSCGTFLGLLILAGPATAFVQDDEPFQ